MRFIAIILFLFLITSISAQTDSTKVGATNTRKYTLKESYKRTIQGAPPLFRSFSGIGFRQSRLAYRIVNQDANIEIIKSNPLPGFFGRIGIYIKSYFKNIGSSSFMAMALLFPIFLLIVLPIIITVFIKVFLIKPKLDNPQRPENDNAVDDEESDDEYEDEEEEEEEDDDDN